MIKKQLVIAVMAMFMAVGFAGLMADSSDAAGFDIVDGTGKTFHYDAPSEHVIPVGFAISLTLVDLGLKDKIVATDTYGGYEHYKDPNLEVLKGLPSIGSIYSAANNDNVIAQLVQWVEEGKITLDDTIIFTTYVTNGTVLRAALEEIGFKHILAWWTITEYGKISDMVDAISMAMTGETSTIAEEMRLVEKEVAEKTAGMEKKKAVFVWWTASVGFKVGKSGSLAVSIIEAAGGESLGKSDASGGSYGDVNTLIQLLENDRDALVLLDSTYSKQYGAEKFRADVLGGDQSINIVEMKQTWNNYCPESMDGLWAIAGELYPELFEGMERPKAYGNDSDNNLVIYALCGAVAVIAIAALAIYVMRRP